MKSKPRSISLWLLFLGILWLQPISPTQASIPFDSLTPEQQRVVQDQYDGFYMTMVRLFPDMDETQRIKLHLSLLEQRLRSKDPSSLSPELKKNRMDNLDRLHEYWQAGLFPKNVDHPGKIIPHFFDKRGVVCAVGYLVVQSGHLAEAQAISRRENLATIHQMKSPELGAWVAQSGLTKDECAMIQPNYSCPWPQVKSTPTVTPQQTPPCEEWKVTEFSNPYGGGLDHIYIEAVASNASGEVAIAGPIKSCFGCFNPIIRVIKYSAGGSVSFDEIYDTGADLPILGGIAMDDFGFVYVALVDTSYAPKTHHTVKYNSIGGIVWDTPYAGASYGRGGIGVDGSGNVYTVVPVNAGITIMSHLVKYYPNGVLAWEVPNELAPVGWSQVYKMAVDISGNVCATGAAVSGMPSTALGPCLLTRSIAHNSSGVTIWDTTSPDTGFDDEPGGVAWDGSGNAYVAGGGGTTKYDSTGSAQWKETMTLCFGMASDASGGVYVMGRYFEPSLGAEVAGVVKYGLNADTLWRFEDPNVVALAAGPSGSLYVGESDIYGNPTLKRFSVFACSFTPTPTSTDTLTPTFTPTSTDTFSPTPTPTATFTFSTTSTDTPSPSATPTLTSTMTLTPSITFTPTATPQHNCVVYPNPCNGPTVKISLPVNGIADAKVQVWTTAARKIRDQDFPQVAPGVDVTLTLLDNAGAPLANGLYYVTATIDGKRSITKLLVLR